MMPGNRSSSHTVGDIMQAVQLNCGGASEQLIKSRSGLCMHRRNFNDAALMPRRAAVAAGRLVAKDWPITESWQSFL